MVGVQRASPVSLEVASPMPLLEVDDRGSVHASRAYAGSVRNSTYSGWVAICSKKLRRLGVVQAERARLFVGQPAHVVSRHPAVVKPLPDLRAGDLRRCRVLHQVVDRHGSVPVQPGGEVLDADRDV